MHVYSPRNLIALIAFIMALPMIVGSAEWLLKRIRAMRGE